MFEAKNHLSLAFHCLIADDRAKPQTNRHLFISVSEMEGLIIDLLGRGYSFDLYSRVQNKNKKTCSISFDDGYFNNMLFLPLAEKYQIPFTIFISAYNILNQSYYLWDMVEPGQPWEWRGGSYSKSYRAMNRKPTFEGEANHFRPLTKGELLELANNKYVHFGNHTYSHTPFSKNYEENIRMELSACDSLFAGFSRYLSKEIALPCGLLSQGHRRALMNKFDHIYTISGGRNAPGKKMVDRVSLESPQVMGPLLGQIEKGCQFFIRSKRKAAVYWYSNF